MDTNGGAARNALSFVRARNTSNVLVPPFVITPNEPSTTAALKLVLVTSDPLREMLTVDPRRITESA